jgi:hypothetical protein
MDKYNIFNPGLISQQEIMGNTIPQGDVIRREARRKKEKLKSE